jgi:ribosome-associated protein
MIESELEEQKSKSQIKREMQALHELGQRLVEAPGAKLAKVTLPEELLEAVRAAKRFRREALRRQLQYIAGLMRKVDADAIRDALDRLDRPHQKEVQAFHEIEGWRDGLISGDSALLTELLDRFATADSQYLRQLVRNAQKEHANNKTPKSARLLFQYLSELRQSEPD